MKFECGHDGCDLCGRRSCEGTALNVAGRTPKGTPRYLVCDYCLERSVETIVRVAQVFAASFELSDPCGLKPKA